MTKMMKGRVSRNGSYAIASSMKDGHDQQPCITCTTFNILAPIYKRLSHEDPGCRESDHRAYWLARNHMILDCLLAERSSIICLQEFWVGNEELVNIYEKRLGDAGYINFKLGRTNNRGDGLLTAVHKDYFRVINYQEVHFNDCGDRVAQLLHVELASPVSQFRNNDIRQEMLIVNTHLLIPHDSSLCTVRLRQATLGLGAATKRSILQCNVGNKSPAYLCCLYPEKNECLQLHLEFDEAVNHSGVEMPDDLSLPSTEVGLGNSDKPKICGSDAN